jgi:hypothetical protein
VARSKSDQPLLRSPVPIERQPQRAPLGAQLDGEPVRFHDGKAEGRAPASLQPERQDDAVAAAFPHLRAQRSLRRRELLARDHSLRELDEPVLDHALGDPHADGPQQPAPRRADGQRERSQPDLDPNRLSLEHHLVGARRNARGHLAIFLHGAVSPCPRSREGHKTSAPSSRTPPHAGQSCSHERYESRRHVHSTASELSKLGIQRSLQLPECATAPDEVYELAKRRGMDFVTITDHDPIAGALALDHLPDTFISEELTAWFKGEPQAVHLLCYGITPDDHDWLQAHRSDVEACAAYLHGNEIAAALAHPFYAVDAPLTARHRRRLAQLFPIWETRNARARRN